MNKMKAHNQESQSNMNPQKALEFLMEGNKRFVESLSKNRNLLQQVNETRDGQWPFAAILSCIDSRTSAELIFDQGLGDVFSIRIAGNFSNTDILGSLEFACKVAGSKLVVVLGHSKCGAIKGACDDVKLGNLTTMLENIKPAVNAIKSPSDPTLRNSQNDAFVEAVAHMNVELTMVEILEKSPVLKEMYDNNEIGLVGGMYNVETGEVEFINYLNRESLNAVLEAQNS
jgi:carbonic anhydrase